MNEREKSIARAAMRAYQQKGVAKTTMTDVAREAGVSRQTVYNAFPNTDAVLRGAIRCYIEDLWQSVLTGWQACASLDEKLDVLLHHFALTPWEFLHSSPVAAELERGHNPAGHDEIAACRAIFREDIAALFTPWNDTLQRQGTSPLAVSDFISWSIEGLKYNSMAREDMMQSIATLKALVLALIK